MSELERVIKVIDWLIFQRKVKSRRELAEKMGYTESSLSQILNNKVPLSTRFINNLLNIDPKINSAWIKSGRGKMLNDDIPNMACEPVQPYTKLDGKRRSEYNEWEEKDYDNDIDNDLIIQTLQEQLRSKDEQLKAKDEQINKLLELLTKK